MKDLDYYKECFKDTLKEFMKDKSVIEFSKELSIPARTINSWLYKQYTPSMQYLIYLAEYFDVSIDYLVGLER